MRIILLSLAFLLAVLCTKAQPAQFVPESKINPKWLTGHWKAHWITHPAESVLDYGVFHFRKSFELATVPPEFIIHVSGDNRYRLFVNGKAVCFGPARGDLEHWNYESIDIAPFLKPGKNVLAATVWNFGDLRPWAQFSLETAFIVQGNGQTEEIANTNSSWKVMKDKAYLPATADPGRQIRQFIVVGPGDRVDAALFPWNWETETYDDPSWLPAKTIDIGHPRGIGSDINWVLTPRNIPQMEQKEQQFGAIRRAIVTANSASDKNFQVPEQFLEGKAPCIIPANRKVTLLFDQSVLTTGYPELLVSKGKGSRVTLIYAESLFDTHNNKGNRNAIEGRQIKGHDDIFLPDGGTNRLFRPLWFRTWRYLQLEIETKAEPLVLEKFTSEFTAYPLQENARFESDQPELTQIWNTGWRTARLCANETYFDCPYYEQLQYVGDTRIQALISLYVSGDDRLVRNALNDFDQSRFCEGLTRSRYPSWSPQVIPPFSLYWIDMVHDYWTLRDDPKFVAGFLNGIDQVINWFTQRIDPETGLLGHVEYWNFVDWADAWAWDNETRMGGVPPGGQLDSHSSILTLQFIYALQRAADLSGNFNRPEQAENYKQLAHFLMNSVYQKCWDTTRKYLADTPEKTEFSMHAQIFGVLTNAIPENQQEDVMKRILTDKTLIQPTLYFRFYLTQALKKTGMANEYLSTLGPWKDMLNNGLTTFAEKPDPTRSDCHAWSASPNYDFLATVAGIRPSSPGFKTIRMEPAMGELQDIKGQMPHPLGTIQFDLKRTGEKGISGKVILPDGLTGIFAWQGKTVKLSGETEIDIQ
jgi:hypothetical protein